MLLTNWYRASHNQNYNELANFKGKSDHFSKLIHHKLSQNCMYWSNLVWSNTNMFEKNVRLSFKKRFLYFWSFCFGVGLWVSVCILVKGLCESEGFSYWREQMKCKNFSFMKTTLVSLTILFLSRLWNENVDFKKWKGEKRY